MQRLLDSLTSAVSRAAVTGAVAGVAALVGLGGVVALFIALYLALAERFTPAEAALMTGLAAFAVCGLTFLILRFRSGGRRAAPGPAAEGNPHGSESLEAMLQLGSSFSGLVQRNKREAAISAFVVGVICGASPAARDRLREISKAFARSERKEKDKP